MGSRAQAAAGCRGPRAAQLSERGRRTCGRSKRARRALAHVRTLPPHTRSPLSSHGVERRETVNRRTAASLTLYLPLPPLSLSLYPCLRSLLHTHTLAARPAALPVRVSWCEAPVTRLHFRRSPLPTPPSQQPQPPPSPPLHACEIVFLRRDFFATLPSDSLSYTEIQWELCKLSCHFCYSFRCSLAHSRSHDRHYTANSVEPAAQGQARTIGGARSFCATARRRENANTKLRSFSSSLMDLLQRGGQRRRR